MKRGTRTKAVEGTCFALSPRHPERNRRWSEGPAPKLSKGPASPYPLVILSVTEGGAKDLLYLSFHIGAKRRSTKLLAASAIAYLSSGTL